MDAKCKRKLQQQELDYLRPVEFAGFKVFDSIDSLGDVKSKELLLELADAALDPDDAFASEVVHLLIVGSVLQSFVSKRDLGGQPSLSGARLLLDTPVLVDLIDEGSPAKELAVNLIQLSHKLEAETVVAEHTLDEWDRLWLGADHENPGILDGRVVPKYFDRLTSSKYSNPFVRQFVRAKSLGDPIRWARFKAERSGIREVLEDLGVRIVACGNTSATDEEVVATMSAAILKASADTTIPGRRTRTSAVADANSTAMVRRWRLERPMTPCGAYFISSEHLTGIAFAAAYVDDAISLTVRPSAWVVFVASLVADDPNERTRLAEMVTDAVFRESFLGLATAYTLEEASALAEVLTEHDVLSLEDSREAAQLDVDQFLETEADGGEDDRIRRLALEVVRRRSARRDARAKRLEKKAQEMMDAATEREQGLERRIEMLEGSGDGDISKLRKENQRLKRAGAVLGIGLLLAILIGSLIATKLLSGRAEVIAVLIGVVFLLDGLRFARRLSVSWWEPILTGAAAAIWAAIAAAARI